MDSKVFSTRVVAEQVRKQFERKQISKEQLAELYSAYNSHVDAGNFVTEAEKIFPRLNCGLASLYLQKMLGGEIVRGLYNGHHHTYLSLHERIIDITADQYGGPNVYVGHLKQPWAASV